MQDSKKFDSKRNGMGMHTESERSIGEGKTNSTRVPTFCDAGEILSKETC